MGGRLQQPALAGALPVEELHQLLLVGVERAEIADLALVPAGVRLEQRLDAELHAMAGEGVEQHALLGRVRAGEVDLRPLGMLRAALRIVGVDRGAARVLGRGRPTLERVGALRLPEPERPRGRILAEQIEEGRGRGAREPGQHHRVRDRAREDPGLARERGLHAQARREQAHHAPAAARPTLRGERVLGVGREQRAEARAKCLVTEVGEPGARARLGEDGLRAPVERLRHVRDSRASPRGPAGPGASSRGSSARTSSRAGGRRCRASSGGRGLVRPPRSRRCRPVDTPPCVC